MTLLAAALLIALVGAGFVVHPMIVRRWGLLGDPVTSAALDREARKRVALAALKEVEYDRVAGKLDELDYQDLKGRLELEALEALQAVETAKEPALSGGNAARHVCGFGNPPGSRFCAGCGQPLS